MKSVAAGKRANLFLPFYRLRLFLPAKALTVRDEKNSAFAVILILLSLAFIVFIVGVSGFVAYRRLAQGLAVDPPAPAELLPPGTITFPPSGIVSFEEIFRSEDADFRDKVEKATAEIQFFLDKPSLSTEEVDALISATKSLETITELYKERLEERKALRAEASE